jgi:hypothetical protein
MFAKRNKRHAKTPLRFALEQCRLLLVGSLFEFEQCFLRYVKPSRRR